MNCKSINSLILIRNIYSIVTLCVFTERDLISCFWNGFWIFLKLIDYAFIISHNEGIPKIEILWKVFNITYIRLFHLNKSPVSHFAHLQIILRLSISLNLHLLREGSNLLLTFKNFQIMKAWKAFKHEGFKWFKIFPFK